MEPLNLRNQPVPNVLVVVRLGSVTLTDPHLSRSVAESHDRWGIWGFSVLEVPDGDYQLLARLRPIVATRRRLLVADGPELIASGLPLLPTLDHPHWTVLVSEPSTAQFAKVRSIFCGPSSVAALRAYRPATASRPGVTVVAVGASGVSSLGSEQIPELCGGDAGLSQDRAESPPGNVPAAVHRHHSLTTIRMHKLGMRSLG